MNDYQNTYDFEHIREQAVGSVEFVSPHEIKVLLDINAPKNTAINTGTPQLFPKVNGFVLIPNEAGALVCIISWVGVEYSQFPKRKGYQDFNLIRSEEHTSELQSRGHLVCRLLLEKKNNEKIM